jgi:hypothetical protein
MRWSARVARAARVGKKGEKIASFRRRERKPRGPIAVGRKRSSAWGGTRDFARCPCERSVPRKRKIRERVRVRRPEKVVGRAAIAPRVLGRGWGSRARLAAAPAGERTWRVLGVRRATAPRAAGRRPPSDVAAGRTTCFACVAAIISFAPGEVAASRRPGAFEDRGLARGRFGDCRSEDASRWFVSRRLGCVEE